MATIPRIKIVEAPSQRVIQRPGMAGKVCVIGAFSKRTDTYTPVVCTSLSDAQDKLGDDIENYNGDKVLPQIFNKNGGVSSIIAVSFTTTTESGGETVVEKTLTNEKLALALGALTENYDTLFIAEELSDTQFSACVSYLDNSRESAKPAGMVAVANRANVTAYQTTAGLFDAGSLYGLIIQQFTVNGEQLSLIESGAYYCGLLSAKKVNQSFTMKRLDGVEAIYPEYTFSSSSDDGYKLVEAGISVAKVLNRSEDYNVIVNSMQPCGRDVYIERTVNYIIREFQLEEFFGEINNDITISAVKGRLEAVKRRMVNELNLLQDIDFDVVKTSPSCIEIIIESLTFYGVITCIDVVLTVEVE